MTKVDATNTCRNTSSTVSARYVHAGSAHRTCVGSPPPPRVCRSGATGNGHRGCGSRCASTACSSVDIKRHRLANLRTGPGELRTTKTRVRRVHDGMALGAAVASSAAGISLLILSAGAQRARRTRVVAVANILHYTHSLQVATRACEA